MDSDPDSPKICAAGSSKGWSVSAVGFPLAVSPPAWTVAPAAVEFWQHKRTVFVMFANGSVGHLNDEV